MKHTITIDGRVWCDGLHAAGILGVRRISTAHSILRGVTIARNPEYPLCYIYPLDEVQAVAAARQPKPQPVIPTTPPKPVDKPVHRFGTPEDNWQTLLAGRRFEDK